MSHWIDCRLVKGFPLVSHLDLNVSFTRRDQYHIKVLPMWWLICCLSIRRCAIKGCFNHTRSHNCRLREEMSFQPQPPVVLLVSSSVQSFSHFSSYLMLRTLPSSWIHIFPTFFCLNSLLISPYFYSFGSSA